MRKLYKIINQILRHNSLHEFLLSPSHSSTFYNYAITILFSTSISSNCLVLFCFLLKAKLKNHTATVSIHVLNFSHTTLQEMVTGSQRCISILSFPCLTLTFLHFSCNRQLGFYSLFKVMQVVLYSCCKEYWKYFFSLRSLLLTKTLFQTPEPIARTQCRSTAFNSSRF